MEGRGWDEDEVCRSECGILIVSLALFLTYIIAEKIFLKNFDHLNMRK